MVETDFPSKMHKCSVISQVFFKEQHFFYLLHVFSTVSLQRTELDASFIWGFRTTQKTHVTWVSPSNKLEPDREQWAFTLTEILQYLCFLSIGAGNLFLGHPVPNFQNGKVIFWPFLSKRSAFLRWERLEVKEETDIHYTCCLIGRCEPKSWTAK
jgi:hypothetical protein